MSPLHRLKMFPHICSLLIWGDKESKSTNSWLEFRQWRAKWRVLTRCLVFHVALNLSERTLFFSIHYYLYLEIQYIRPFRSTRTHAHTNHTHIANSILICLIDTGAFRLCHQTMRDHSERAMNKNGTDECLEGIRESSVVYPLCNYCGVLKSRILGSDAHLKGFSVNCAHPHLLILSFLIGSLQGCVHKCREEP